MRTETRTWRLQPHLRDDSSNWPASKSSELRSPRTHTQVNKNTHHVSFCTRKTPRSYISQKFYSLLQATQLISITSLKQRLVLPLHTHTSTRMDYTSPVFVWTVNKATQFFSFDYAHIFSRSSGNAAEPLVCGLRQPPVDSDPTSYQTVPAQHHQSQVRATLQVLLSQPAASCLILLFVSVTARSFSTKYWSTTSGTSAYWDYL